MTQTANDETYRLRLLKRLGVIVDEGKPYRIRLCATRSIQAMLPDSNPLKRESAEDLLDRILQPWDSRVYLERGRGQLRTVSRPPRSLRDVWS